MSLYSGIPVIPLMAYPLPQHHNDDIQQTSKNVSFFSEVTLISLIFRGTLLEIELMEKHLLEFSV